KIDYVPGSYPLVKENKTPGAFPVTTGGKPDIFILMVESFNAGFIESRSPGGEEYTPFFNRLIQRGVYVDYFYGNSIQTGKGQVAVLCSIVPSIRSKIFREYPALSLETLPAILKKQGYETIFFQAHKDVEFDNTREFMRRHGFDRIETAFRFLDEDEKKQCEGWYMRDRVFYTKFFSYLDERASRGPRPPVFALLPTIYNHSRFNNIPVEFRYLYKKPKDKAQHYANSIRLVDEDLKVFFREFEKREYLKDTVLIITGDHSYPVGGHGIFNNEAGFYEESFRTPFLMIRPGKLPALPPARITRTAYSQLDIAPTILDMLDIAGIKNHFTGVSILRGPRGESSSPPTHPVYLVQPYSGRYLGVVRLPYKYLFHEKTGREYIYDIDRDPGETTDIFSIADPALKETFKKDLRFIYLNQILIEADGIWPKAGQKKEK
ncbi:MAG: sulfatase-like hydrolase/transferase, partial [bacterium]|nr:sulfatase-like hydrolase/transferase [bacterium]